MDERAESTNDDEVMVPIDPLVIEAFEAGRSTWPNIGLRLEEFARRASELGIAPRELSLRSGDVVLAWGCAVHDSAALSYFEEVFLPRVGQYVAHVRLTEDVVDEVRQELRIALLAATEPAIGKYRGNGPLGAWVRVSAIRIAVNMAALKKIRPANDADALSNLVSNESNPELAAFKARYGGAFQVALDRSLATLDRRDKTILRLHFLDRLNIDGIGKIYRVHRATVARWLVDIRQRVFASLREELELQFDATSSEFRSILTLVKDDLDVSIQRLLESKD